MIDSCGGEIVNPNVSVYGLLFVVWCIVVPLVVAAGRGATNAGIFVTGCPSSAIISPSLLFVGRRKRVGPPGQWQGLILQLRRGHCRHSTQRPSLHRQESGKSFSLRFRVSSMVITVIVVGLWYVVTRAELFKAWTTKADCSNGRVLCCRSLLEKNNILYFDWKLTATGINECFLNYPIDTLLDTHL